MSVVCEGDSILLEESFIQRSKHSLNQLCHVQHILHRAKNLSPSCKQKKEKLLLTSVH